MYSFHENKVQILVSKPHNVKPIATKQVFRIKYDHLGHIYPAFLKGDLKKDIWVELSNGMNVKLDITLYGLKQSPMEWSNTRNETDSNETASTDFPYRLMVGSLMYAMLGTRPDLAFPMSIVSRDLDKLTKLVYKFVIQIFKYLRKNSYELTYTKPDILGAYVDASYGNQIYYNQLVDI